LRLLEFLGHVVDHVNAAVITCEGVYEAPGMSPGLKFIFAWLKKDGRSQFQLRCRCRCLHRWRPKTT
jgi:hypothetical protein